jgi:dynein heavy chain, axonemal
MRDISKVFQGLYNAQKANQDTKDHLIKLWGHEVLRVFHDRLISIADQNLLKSILNEQLTLHFQVDYKESCTTKLDDGTEVDAVFVDFLQGDDNNNYEEVSNFEALIKRLNDSLTKYN